MPKKSSEFSTIKDVARLAGVSIATVSAALNNKDRVSVEMRQRVEDAMRALDYHPDRTARSLKTGRSNIIGMVVPDLKNPFFVELMCGVEEQARKAGYSVIFSNSNKNRTFEEETLVMLYSQRVAGAVLCSMDAHSAYDRLTRRRFPIVFVDRLPVSGFSGRAVTVDNVGAAYDATKHLIAFGHRDIAIITGRMDISNGADRFEGFRKAMQDANLPIQNDYYQLGDFTWDCGYLCGLKLLRLPNPPTAIFSCNNNTTLGLMRALNECERACPDDVSVLSFDDFPWASHFQPRLTAVAQPSFEMGRRAVRMLLSELDPDHEQADCSGESMVVLKAELHVRQSTAPASNRIHANGSVRK